MKISYNIKRLIRIGILGILTLCILLFGLWKWKFEPDDTMKAASGQVTVWDLTPSFKYDVICFLNTLVGDEYYLRFYQRDYDAIKGKFTPEVKEALQVLSEVRDERKIIISATLSSVFSKTDDETLDDMIATLNSDDDTIWGIDANTPAEDKQKMDMVKKELVVVCSFLKDIDFHKYWTDNILPKVKERIQTLKAEGAMDHDVIPEIEKYTGIKLSSDTITMYLSYFSQPHGISLGNNHFITDISNDTNTILRNAVHEMMHPPFNPKDEAFKGARSKLADDTFIQKMMAKQDSTHGYSTYESYFEENCVDALETTICEKFDLLPSTGVDYIKQQDGGIDGLGSAIYSLIKQEDYTKTGESFEAFIIRMINSGKLADGKVEQIYNELK